MACPKHNGCDSTTMIGSDSFAHIIPKEFVFFDEPMKNHTTFRTGGACDILFVPQTKEQLVLLLKELRQAKIKTHLIGRGSNILVADGGIRGAVVKLGFCDVSVSDNIIFADAGVSLYSLATFAKTNGRTGLEFAAGIPGTLGGSLIMNAGAYGCELGDFVRSVEVLNNNLDIKTLDASEINFSYRNSSLLENKQIVLSASFKLEPADKEEISSKMADLAKRRQEKQPLNYPSAGSTFKRPPGDFAGRLIEECNLSGFSVGGAQVSEKHCGFIINKGDATSKDIYTLICHVKQTVYEKTGVLLEQEVHLIGDFN